MGRKFVYDAKGELQPENLELKRKELKRILSEKDVVFHLLYEEKKEYRKEIICPFVISEKKYREN